MARKKIELEEQAISEILIADTGLESGDEAGDVEHFEEGEQQQQPASSEVKPQAATSVGLPTWGPPQGTQNSSFCPSSKRCLKK
jgi:hypothetical protein